MSGIAELLANQGYAVSGSDAKASDVTRRLETLGVRVVDGHAAEHVGDADVVVVSSAVRADQPRGGRGAARGIPVIPRAEMLAELMRLKQGIAVAGAHGKTTTTSMVALAPRSRRPRPDRGDRRPAQSAFGSNARLGQGSYLVAEADESDGSFLELCRRSSPSSPTSTASTSTTTASFDGVLDAFVAFANKVPFYGVVIACADDATPAWRCGPRITRRVVTYGIDSADADVRGDVGRARGVRLDAAASPAPHGRELRHARRARSRAGPPQPAQRARPPWPSASSWACRSRRSPPRSPSSAAPSAASSCSARPTACWSSTTTATTRPRSPPSSPPPAPASSAASSWSFQPHRYSRTERCCRSSARRWPRPTWSC